LLNFINKYNKERIVKMKNMIGKIFEERAFAKAFKEAEAAVFMIQKEIQLNN
jgi:hypothetical protein